MAEALVARKRRRRRARHCSAAGPAVGPPPVHRGARSRSTNEHSVWTRRGHRSVASPSGSRSRRTCCGPAAGPPRGTIQVHKRAQRLDQARPQVSGLAEWLTVYLVAGVADRLTNHRGPFPNPLVPRPSNERLNHVCTRRGPCAAQ